jgi:competence protein ComEC
MTDYYARPIIALLIALIAGLAFGSEFPGHFLGAGVILFIGAGSIFIQMAPGKKVWVSPLILFFAAGYLSLQPWVCPQFASNHIVHYAETSAWNIVGVIDNYPLNYGKRQNFVIRTETLEKNNDSVAVTGKIRVTVSGFSPQLARGDRVFFPSRIKSIRNFNNPGGFDYRRYLGFQGVCGSAFVQGSRLSIVDRNSGGAVTAIVSNARKSIADLIDRSGQGDQIGVLKALLVGDRAAIPQRLREAFNRAGVGHLLAISGLHIGIVATAAFVFFQWVLGAIKPLLWNAWTRKGAALLALLPVSFYALVSGLSPSTQRAVIMISVFLMTFLFEREHDLMNTLALAALVILVVYPPALFSISFQLSFAAVLSIIYAFSRLQARRNFRAAKENQPGRRYVKRWLRDFFLVSCFAVAGTLPLVMFYFNQISLVGILANFIVVPLVGFIVVPLGLIGVFWASFCLAWALWCFKACGAVLALALKMVAFFSDFPLAALKTATPTVFEIVCYYLLAWALLSLVCPDRDDMQKQDVDIRVKTSQAVKDLGDSVAAGGRRPSFFLKKFMVAKPIERKRDPPASNERKLAAMIAAVVVIALSADTGYWLHHRLWHADLRVTILDVGQGNAALVELPGGGTMLIDGGGFSDNSTFDMGARVVAPFLWHQKIKTVDTLILSHPDSDHLNGLIYIAENFNVQQIWTNHENNNTAGYRKFMQIIAQKKIPMPEFEDLPRQQTIGDVELDILHPQYNFRDKSTGKKFSNLNNNSVVVKISFGSISFLFPGDIMASAEKELVRNADGRLASTVLLAPHHGSRLSSTQAFIESVRPEVVIFSSGRNSSANYPHPSILQRYRDCGCRIFRTDAQGAISATTDGRQVWFKPFTIENNHPNV